MREQTGNLAEVVSTTERETAGAAGSPSNASEKPVELARLQDICCGDKEFERELIQVFLSDTLDRIRTMEKALHEMNLEIFRIQAHSIKGASANAGAETLTSIALSMEEAQAGGNRNGDGRDVSRLMNDLKQEYEKVRAFLTHYMDTGLPPMEDPV